jgi:DNA-binding transcriptional regulator YiaG
MIEATTSTRILDPQKDGEQRNSRQVIAITPLNYFAFNDDLIQEFTRLADNRTHDGGARLNDPNLFARVKVSILQTSSRFNDALAKVSETLSIQRPAQVLETPPHINAVQWIKDKTDLSNTRIAQMLGITRQTIDEWKKGTPISDANRRRLFAVQDVLERAASRYKTRDLLVAWLDTPQGSTGRTPTQLLEANEINKARLLAMSSPSPHLVAAPAWVNRQIPKKFQAHKELRQESLPPELDEPAELEMDTED